MPLFGDRVLIEIIRLKLGHYGGPNPMTPVLMKGNLDTETDTHTHTQKMSCEHQSGNQNAMCTGQGS